MMRRTIQDGWIRAWRGGLSLTAALIVLAPLTAAAATVEFTTSLPDGGGLIPHRVEVHSLMELRHQNVVIQQKDYSCGAASLATVFNYYLNEPVKESDIIRTLLELNLKHGTLESVIQRKGFSMLDLKMFSESRGVKAVGYRLDFDDLANLGVQAIVPIIPNGYKHFVVFRAADKQRVYLSDPSFGNYTESIEEFKHDWYGFINVALAFFPDGMSESQIGKKPLVPQEMDRVYAVHEGNADLLNQKLPDTPFIKPFIPGEW